MNNSRQSFSENRCPSTPLYLGHHPASKCSKIHLHINQNKNLGKYYRINQNIKYPEVRVLDQDGKQLGIMPTKQALDQAINLGLDLVEITDKATPPIVKIIEFQKFRYQEEKKDRQGVTKGGQETKEIRLKPFMAENDMMVKCRQAEKFLKSGDRVKLVVKFQGREITKKDFGEKLIKQVITNLSEISTIVEEPKYMGKLLIAQIKPKK